MKPMKVNIKKTELIKAIIDLGKHNKWIHGITVWQDDTILLDEVF